jgi:hypothetical protein
MSRERAQRFWIITHTNGHVWPNTFSYWKTTAISKFVDDKPNYHKSWRALKKEGFSAIRVQLRLDEPKTIQLTP